MNIIKIDNNIVRRVILAPDTNLEKEAEKIGGVIYDGELPDSKFLKLDEENKKVIINQELQDEYNRTEYQRLRKAEYAKLNQMEMMYDDKVNGTDTWGEAIQAIKEKYPKPE